MVLGWPAGRYLVGAAGLVVIGVGFWNLYRGLSRKFEDKWRVGKLSPQMRKWGGRAGVLGHSRPLRRLRADRRLRARRRRSTTSRRTRSGIDGALQKLAHASYGPFLLGLTAAGLVAYGIYCLVDARLRDVSANS